MVGVDNGGVGRLSKGFPTSAALESTCLGKLISTWIVLEIHAGLGKGSKKKLVEFSTKKRKKHHGLKTLDFA